MDYLYRCQPSAGSDRARQVPEHVPIFTKSLPAYPLTQEEQVLTIGDKLPDFSLTALVPGRLADVEATGPGDYFTTVEAKDYPGKWLVLFFWPKDFTFVCPTEIAEFGRLNGEFAARDAQVLGASVDTEYVHYAWRTQHRDLLDLPFPMLADVKRELASALGVLGEDGVAQRATFIVDPDGLIQFVMVTAGSVGRNVSEVLRALDALQTEELTACNWQKGQPTIDVVSLMAEAAA
jgi:alkyl hydroperoxide reductase subunit AhpC